MRPACLRLVVGIAALFALCAGAGCARIVSAPGTKPSATAVSVAATTTSPTTTSPTATASATAGATPVAGQSFKVGDYAVVVDRFRAQVASAQGVNIRSSPEVTATNRTGSLAPGAQVDVEGRVLQGQEAEPGNGTLWYYVGTVGSTAQFIYGPEGTLAPVTGSATPSASTTLPTPSASPTATP
jgi:hypothetical protein